MTVLDQPRGKGEAVSPPEPETLPANPAFSVINPRLQLAWDATSLRALMFCPRYYQLNIIEGYQAESLDLDYGLFYEAAIEIGDWVMAGGGSVDEAQARSFDWALERTGSYVPTPPGTNIHPDNPQLCCGRDHECGEGDCSGPLPSWRPWSGAYHQLWRCTHAPSPGRKKCEFALAGRWHEPPEPGDVCGAILPEGKGGGVPCGSLIETEWVWVPEHSAKHRETLLRAVIWYWEEQRGGAVEQFVFGDGKVAAQVHFTVPLGVMAGTGEEFLLCGYNDRFVTFGGELFIAERKTTGSALTRHYMDGFTPNVQIDTYDLAIVLAWPGLPIKGVMLEAHQALATGARFARRFLHRSPSQREEWRKELVGYWLTVAGRLASTGVYPMNRASCRMCRDFRDVCAKPPESRERFLKGNFKRRMWNPLAER